MEWYQVLLPIQNGTCTSSFQAYSIENLYHSSPETRGIRVTIKGDGDKPACCCHYPHHWQQHRQPYYKQDYQLKGGADENKFSLSGTTLTFKATDFEARDAVVVMARLGSTVMVNLLEVLLPAGSVT
jgi:hypothetical protein